MGPSTRATDLQSFFVSGHSPVPGHEAWRAKCGVDFSSLLIPLIRNLV